MTSSDRAAEALGGRQLRTPRAAALAGVVYALLHGTSLVLLWVAIPEQPTADATLLREADTISVALTLMPFAGIAFLWFMGVVRDRLGALEDRFFATVLLGAGLLYLAMTFVATGIAGGLLASYAADPQHLLGEGVYGFGRSVTHTVVTSYAMRMAGVFMVTLGTIWLRTGSMPRWVPLGTYGLALMLLVAAPRTLWGILLFPVWVLVVSALTLLAGPPATAAGDEQPGRWP